VSGAQLGFSIKYDILLRLRPAEESLPLRRLLFRQSSDKAARDLPEIRDIGEFGT
jgi:hypothetical protein